MPDDRLQSLITNHQSPPLINIGCGEDLTIRELAGLVKDVVGFEGEVVFDATKPDGTPQKLLDVSRLGKLGWRAATELRGGIDRAYRSFLAEAGSASLARSEEGVRAP